jgi:hypothetical protein
MIWCPEITYPLGLESEKRTPMISDAIEVSIGIETEPGFAKNLNA